MQRSTFLLALALVTALPLLGLGAWLGLTHPEGPRSPILLSSLMPIIVATGYGHVASSAYFYTDRGFWKIMHDNRVRFFYAPVLFVAIALALVSVGPTTGRIFKVAYFVWQLWHYQRQNYGIMAFAAQQRKLGPLPQRLQTVFNVAAAGGICAMLARPDMIGIHPLRYAGEALFMASGLLLLWTIIFNRRVSSDLPVLLFAVLGWAFFLPSLLSSDLLVSFTSYAVAHGAQYLLIMMVMSAGRSRRIVGLLTMVVTTAATWLLFDELGTSPAGLTALQGLVIGHFVIDAKIWRMREAPQRNLIRSRFAFLFAM